MKFTEFNNKTEVIEKFNLKFKRNRFIDKCKIPFKIEKLISDRIISNFYLPGVFNCEYSICEMIISPILLEVSRANDLPIWSHCYLEDKELDLSGVPDYLFALSKEGGDMYKKPVVCIGEAKKDKFDAAWGQIVAEMVVAQKQNENNDIPIYGLATNGKLWEFAKLEDKTITQNETKYLAPEQFNEVLDILNWIFCEGKKNADLIEELEQKGEK